MGLARTVGLVAALGLAATLTSCAQPAYRYVGSSDRDLVLRVPRAWTAIDAKAVFKASGVDPSTQPGWTAFYDASPKPDITHLQTSTIDPVLRVQSIPLTKDQAATVTSAALRQMMLPGTPDEQATATAQHLFALLQSTDVSTPTARGAHVMYLTKSSSASEMVDAMVLTDPKTSRLRTVVVQCSSSCFTAHKAEIDDAVTSLTLKPVH